MMSDISLAVMDLVHSQSEYLQQRFSSEFVLSRQRGEQNTHQLKWKPSVHNSFSQRVYYNAPQHNLVIQIWLLQIKQKSSGLYVLFSAESTDAAFNDYFVLVLQNGPCVIKSLARSFLSPNVLLLHNKTSRIFHENCNQLQQLTYWNKRT